jgi:tellurite resistance-related uncharacterized protein
MKSLPTSAVFYKSTPVFNETTIPAGLQRDHTIASGVWAKINVLEGSLEYHITEPLPEKHLLGVGDEGIIEPQVKHYVVAPSLVRFRVDFYR